MFAEWKKDQNENLQNKVYIWLWTYKTNSFYVQTTVSNSVLRRFCFSILDFNMLSWPTLDWIWNAVKKQRFYERFIFVSLACSEYPFSNRGCVSSDLGQRNEKERRSEKRHYLQSFVSLFHWIFSTYSFSGSSSFVRFSVITVYLPWIQRKHIYNRPPCQQRFLVWTSQEM